MSIRGGSPERERELHVDALRCKAIVSLLKTAGLMGTVHKVGRCYDRLVNEFIVNVSPEVGSVRTRFGSACISLCFDDNK